MFFFLLLKTLAVEVQAFLKDSVVVYLSVI